MPISKAAMDGIEMFGSGWMVRGPSIADLAKQVGKLRDNPPENWDNYQDIGKKIRHKLLKWIDNNVYVAPAIAEIKKSIRDVCADDLNEMEFSITSSEDLEELICILDSIYDKFDYYRVLVS